MNEPTMQERVDKILFMAKELKDDCKYDDYYNMLFTIERITMNIEELLPEIKQKLIDKLNSM